MLTAERLKAVADILDLLVLDTANVGHEVGNIASAITDLLVDVVVAKNLVDFSEDTRDVAMDVDNL